MRKLITKIWQNFTLKTKIIIIVMVLVIGYIGFLISRAGYYEYKYLKSQANRVESLVIKVDTLENRERREVQKISNAVNKSRASKNVINQKRKDDEKNIDNSTIDDSKRKKFISRFNDD